MTYFVINIQEAIQSQAILKPTTANFFNATCYPSTFCTFHLPKCTTSFIQILGYVCVLIQGRIFCMALPFPTPDKISSLLKWWISNPVDTHTTHKIKNKDHLPPLLCQAGRRKKKEKREKKRS
jgi:hypothetical protein